MIFSPFASLGASGAVASRADLTGGHLLWANLCWFNLVWGIFNLMPIVPLDGGHVVEHVLGLKLRPRAAARIASLVSLVACVAVLGLVYVLVGTLPMFTLLIVGMLAFTNFERFRATS